MAPRRVLVRVYRDPFDPPTAEILDRDALLGGNSGNLLFSDAAVKALACADVELSCWTYEQMVAEADSLHERFDHVVLPFANAFRGGYRDQLRGFTALVERLRLPVTVLGVGAQAGFDYPLDDLLPVREDAAAFARAVLERSPSIGVRGAFTAAFLADLGFADVEVIGCPSMYTYGSQLPMPEPRQTHDPSTRVALHLTPDVTLPGGWLDGLLDRHPRLVYLPQGRMDLTMMLWGRRPGVKASRSDPAFPYRLDHRLFTDATARMHLDSETWIDDLRTFDVSVGTRIHGTIAALLVGTPSVLLAHDSRTRELAEHFEIPCTRANALGAPDLDPLVAGHDHTASSRGHVRRFAGFTGFLDRHGLPHRWRQDAASTWDELRSYHPRVSPVEIGGRIPVELVTRLGWVRARHEQSVQKLSRQLRRQEQRLEEAEATIERLTVQLDRAQRPGER